MGLSLVLEPKRRLGTSGSWATAVLISLLLMPTTISWAWRCPPPSSSLTQFLNAEAVFSGYVRELTSDVGIPQPRISRRVDGEDVEVELNSYRAWIIDVTQVWKGEVGSQAKVVTDTRFGGALHLPLNEKVVLYVGSSQGALWGSACSRRVILSPDSSEARSELRYLHQLNPRPRKFELPKHLLKRLLTLPEDPGASLPDHLSPYTRAPRSSPTAVPAQGTESPELSEPASKMRECWSRDFESRTLRECLELVGRAGTGSR